VDTIPKIIKSNFTQNKANLGGAIFVGDQKLIIEESIFEENIAYNKGGVIASLTQSNVVKPEC